MGAAVKITRTDHTASELRVLAAKTRDVAQSRRLLAIAMVSEGSSRLDGARQTGMDRQTLRDWVHRYNEAGSGGLVSLPTPGPTSKRFCRKFPKRIRWSWEPWAGLCRE